MNEQIKEQRNDDEIEIDLAEVFHVLVRNLWILIICAVIGAGSMFSYARFFVTPQYQSTSMIYILSKSTSISSYLDVQIGQQLTVDFETLATTRVVVNQVIDKLNLDTTYEKLLNDISIENPSKTQILKISVKNPDPELAKDIANAMADATANRIAEVMVTDKPTTVEPAVVSKSPVSPNVKKNTMIGGIVGFIIAAAAVVVRMLMNDTIVDKDDVTKYLNLTTLAAIPVNDEDKSSHGRRK